MEEHDKRMLAKKAHEVADVTAGRIGPDTPAVHSAALLAIATSWHEFGYVLERELPDPRR